MRFNWKRSRHSHPARPKRRLGRFARLQYRGCTRDQTHDRSGERGVGCHKADVAQEESCRNAVIKTIDLFGAVHILVNSSKAKFLGPNLK